MRAYGYGMASFDPQASSTEKQEAVALEHFSIFRHVGKLPRDATWGGLFRDEAALKPAKFRERQAGSLLLAAVQPGDVVMATSSERIFISVIDACETIELAQQRGFRLVLLDDGVDTAAHETLLSPLVAMFKALRTKERRRTKDVFADRKRHGLPAGGKPAIGWAILRADFDGTDRAYFVPDHGARRVAQFIAEHYDQWGGNFGQTAYWLNAQGIFRPDGKPWRKTAVYNWYHAAKGKFPLPNGRHEACPVPLEAMPSAARQRYIVGDD